MRDFILNENITIIKCCSGSTGYVINCDCGCRFSYRNHYLKEVIEDGYSKKIIKCPICKKDLVHSMTIINE